MPVYREFTNKTLFLLIFCRKITKITGNFSMQIINFFISTTLQPRV